jgi:HAD superfamily hydrolase (TIGR01509 family)
MSTDKRSIRTLLFDWDGTLVDSAQLGLVAFEKSFAALGFDFDQEIYRANYSPNWYSLYEALGLPREKWDLADELWIRHYGEQTARPVEGAQETIAKLHDRGYRLGIVSSGSDCRVGRELEQLNLRSLFQVVVCNEHMVHKKPHPEGLETALRMLGSVAEESCYVGDSPEDIQMGKSASLFTVGIRSTYPTSWKLATADPDIYLETLPELAWHF